MQWPNKGWVVQVFKEVGVSMLSILETYFEIIQDNDDFWAQNGQPLHLIDVLKAIFETFLEKPQVVVPNERRLFVDKCLQVLLVFHNATDIFTEMAKNRKILNPIASCLEIHVVVKQLILDPRLCQ